MVDSIFDTKIADIESYLNVGTMSWLVCLMRTEDMGYCRSEFHKLDPDLKVKDVEKEIAKRRDLNITTVYNGVPFYIDRSNPYPLRYKGWDILLKELNDERYEPDDEWRAD